MEVVEYKNAKGEESRDLRQQVTEGLLYAHSRTNANTGKNLEALSFLYAMIELLEEKGLLDVEELDERKRAVGERLTERFQEKGMGAVLQDPEYDKYTFQDAAEIDCEKRVHLCKAACCRIPFALSRQDIREGIVLWELGRPYMIDHGEDGYCSHLERGACGCSIYSHRPVPCRGYDCRGDQRVWLDFEKKVANPEIERPDWPQCLEPEAGEAEAGR